MQRADYLEATKIAEKLISEESRLGHYDAAYGAYLLWKRLTRRYQTAADSKHLFELSKSRTSTQESMLTEQSDGVDGKAHGG